MLPRRRIANAILRELAPRGVVLRMVGAHIRMRGDDSIGGEGDSYEAIEIETSLTGALNRGEEYENVDC